MKNIFDNYNQATYQTIITLDFLYKNNLLIIKTMKNQQKKNKNLNI